MSNTPSSHQKHGTDTDHEKGGRQGSEQSKGGQHQPGKGGRQDQGKGGHQDQGRS